MFERVRLAVFPYDRIAEFDMSKSLSRNTLGHSKFQYDNYCRRAVLKIWSSNRDISHILFSSLSMCSIHYTEREKIMKFGQYIREAREALQKDDVKGSNRYYSLRSVATRVNLEPSYLSKIERDVFPPPSEEAIVRIAKDLKLDPDVLLAMAGKLSTDLQQIIMQRPQLFGQLLRELKSQPDHAILRIAREIEDGEW